LEKRPKIHFYHPHIAVITGIAWDHINVFPTYEIYCEQFRIFMDQLSHDDVLIYNAGDKEVVHILESKEMKMQLLPYATPRYYNKDGKVVLPTDSGEKHLNIFGIHNLQNLEAARKVCNCLGVSDL
jgi:UDP-N-acetylmuramate: L-alanyl-gamma-D-glutamyl-meso-diaminopimelate ligase